MNASRRPRGRRTMPAGLIWVAAAVLGAGGAAACPLAPADGQRLQDGPVQLAFVAEPAPIAVNRALRLAIRVCPADARLVAVDATMPEHRHGMNYRPTLRSQGEGRWLAQGLLLHMAGRWELRFDVAHEGRLIPLRHDVVLR